MAHLKSLGLGVVTSGLACAVALGCSGASGSNSGTGTGGYISAGGAGNGTGNGGGGGLNLGGGNNGGSGNSGGAIVCTPGQPRPDVMDVPGNGKDDDCDGVVDNAPANCDSAITDVADNDPMDAAKAIGLCQVSDGNSWGVISANYVMADGTPLGTTIGHGLLDNWGPQVHVQEGTRMLVISSGTARRPSDLGFQSPSGAEHDGPNGPEESAMPPGFPYDPPSCPPGSSQPGTANDPVALELKIKAPANAKSISFNINFYTYEFPQFICSEFNDFFVVLQDPAPANAKFGNISFDSQGNAISVNNSLLQVCVAQNAGGKNFACPLGPGDLTQTGFDEVDPTWGGPHAATGWLQTVSPVDPGSVFTLRFAVWDVGDHILDSTVLIDNFQFSVDETTTSQTTPVPTPK
jgi:hypothetical protein